MMKPYFNSFIGISIGVNVLALLLCLYILIKFLRIYKIKNYPFALSVLDYYLNKRNVRFYEKFNNKQKLSLIFVYLLVFIYIRLSYKYHCLLVPSLIIFYVALMTCFYCFISDFFIFVIKLWRYVKDFYNYLKTGNTYGKCYYKYNKEYKWIKCFHSDELKNVEFFTVGCFLFLLSLGFLALFVICEVFAFEFSDEVKGLIFKRFFAVIWILAFFSCLIAIIKEIVKKKIFKLRYEYFKEVSFYPSGNVKKINLYKNGHHYMEQVFFDKKNRLYSYIFFNFHRLYFYSGNVAFEFFEKNNSIVYYKDNPRKEIVAEAFFNEYRNLIYFVEYNFVKVFKGKNVKLEIVRKDDDFIGWKYLKLGNGAYIKQDMKQDEVENILQRFDLEKRL